MGLGFSAGDKPPPPHYPPPSPYPPPPPPHYKPTYVPYYEEVCHLKEWSSDTELCTPGLVPACEQQKVKVLKVVKPPPKCVKVQVPRCKTTNDAEEIEMCSFDVKSKEQELYATLFEQEMIKRCDTHYQTECEPSYGGYPKCKQVPVQVRHIKSVFRCSFYHLISLQNCYDVPVLKPVNVPVKVKSSEVKEDCGKRLIPTPKTVCWEEEEELCASVPELKEKDEHLNKCSLTLSEDECEEVRLTIPRELCFHVQKFHQPYPYVN